MEAQSQRLRAADVTNKGKTKFKHNPHCFEAHCWVPLRPLHVDLCRLKSELELLQRQYLTSEKATARAEQVSACDSQHGQILTLNLCASGMQ